ncbi:chymotrypsin-like elastase family member 1 [Stylophora pistillata]|uniref:chymotrypsin-like elastase family member 1 n=1 Tax=Stylophora pistillata TaxID=50429 RepID=UPI000C039758|nr:chymotrypsin-like elastase family member 1 [Stylophora pistillata]
MASNTWLFAFLLLMTFIDLTEAQEGPEMETPENEVETPENEVESPENEVKTPEMEAPENNSSSSPFLKLPACGFRPSRVLVVGGVNAMPNSWPWMISLQRKGAHHCGGSLISTNWVLTAAHCLFERTPSLYTVVVGAHSLSGSTPVQETFKVKRLITHPNYTQGTENNDIALLELDRKVTLSLRVNLVCLPQKGSRIPPGTRCTITGWGLNSTYGAITDILQQEELPVASHSDCTKRNTETFVDERWMLCAGGLKDSAACKGDSGGPLSCLEGTRWVVRGVTSMVPWPCENDLYSVFARGDAIP